MHLQHGFMWAALVVPHVKDSPFICMFKSSPLQSVYICLPDSGPAAQFYRVFYIFTNCLKWRMKLQHVLTDLDMKLAQANISTLNQIPNFWSLRYTGFLQRFRKCWAQAQQIESANFLNHRSFFGWPDTVHVVHVWSGRINSHSVALMMTWCRGLWLCYRTLTPWMVTFAVLTCAYKRKKRPSCHCVQIGWTWLVSRESSSM